MSHPRRIPFPLLASLLVLGPLPGQATRTAAPISATRLRATVEHLASKELLGRGLGTEENAAAARWIAERFAAIGLKPAVGESWFHEFQLSGRPCRNVAGLLEVPGASEYVIVAAHHDHLGGTAERYFPGADDNASGVAGMLALAEHFAGVRDELKRHMVFVSFDAEEKGMVGSRRFVSHDVIPVDKTAFLMVFDLIGGCFLPGEEKRFYALGSEHSPAVREALLRHEDAEGVETAILGTYLIEPLGPGLARSDYEPYRRKEVPYLFFTTATPWYYHTPYDTPDRLDYAKMVAIVGIARDVLFDLATRPEKPAFVAKPPGELREAKELIVMLKSLLERRERLGVDEKRAAALRESLAGLEQIVTEGSMDDRGKRLGQRAIVQILQIAERQHGEDR